MDETPLIQQHLQLRSEFMEYLYAMIRVGEKGRWENIRSGSEPLGWISWVL